ncbi:MAG: hypothetical protein K2X48_12785 [Chitinophagaceae bacterium]|nr:hypothetical protein [Chitinophagaceae bacterium]
MPFTLAISPNRTPLQKNYWLILFIAVFTGVFISTLIGTTNMSNCILENTLTFFIPAVSHFLF